MDEILRTATSSFRLKPIYDRALDSLKSLKQGQQGGGLGRPGFNTLRLEQLVSDLQKCREGMRSVACEEAEALLADIVKGTAGDILKVEPENVASSQATTKDVDALISALDFCKDVPGFFDLAKQVRAWKTVNQQHMSIADLLDFAKESHDKQIVGDLQDLQTIMSRLVKVDVGNDISVQAWISSLVVSSFRAWLAELKKEKGVVAPQQFLRRAALIERVWQLVWNPDSEVAKCGSCHVALLKAGAQMCRDLSKVEQLGTDSKARVAKDKNFVLLSGILRQSDVVAKQKKSLLTFQKLLGGDRESVVTSSDMPPPTELPVPSEAPSAPSVP